MRTISAQLTDHHDGTGTLEVVSSSGATLAALHFTADNAGPNRGSVMGTANHLLPELGYALAYGWMDERANEWGTLHVGRCVRLCERTETWD